VPSIFSAGKADQFFGQIDRLLAEYRQAKPRGGGRVVADIRAAETLLDEDQFYRALKSAKQLIQLGRGPRIATNPSAASAGVTLDPGPRGYPAARPQNYNIPENRCRTSAYGA